MSSQTNFPHQLQRKLHEDSDGKLAQAANYLGISTHDLMFAVANQFPDLAQPTHRDYHGVATSGDEAQLSSSNLHFGEAMHDPLTPRRNVSEDSPIQVMASRGFPPAMRQDLSSSAEQLVLPTPLYYPDTTTTFYSQTGSINVQGTESAPFREVSSGFGPPWVQTVAGSEPIYAMPTTNFVRDFYPIDSADNFENGVDLSLEFLQDQDGQVEQVDPIEPRGPDDLGWPSTTGMEINTSLPDRLPLQGSNARSHIQGSSTTGDSSWTNSPQVLTPSSHENNSPTSNPPDHNYEVATNIANSTAAYGPCSHTWALIGRVRLL
jgi:hypothetical protein